MNQTTQREGAATEVSRTATMQAPYPGEKRRKNAARLRLLQRVIAAVGGMIFLMGLLLLILPTFRVKSIRVEGSTHYTEEEIIEASGIKLGDEILAIGSKDEIRKRIWTWDTNRYIDEVQIKTGISSVIIRVAPPKNLMYTEFNDKYYMIDRNFRVLREGESEEDFVGIPRVELPTILSLAVGSELNFEEDTDLSYVGALLDTLEDARLLENVTVLNVSSKFSLSYQTANGCRVELGRAGDLSSKLLLAEEILGRRGEARAIVDVSDPQKPTYRRVEGAELLLAE